MKFQLVSDLHQEHIKEGSDLKVLDAKDIKCDVLLMAGDICEHPHQMQHLPKAIPILHVLGNHEHYDNHWVKTLDYFRNGWRDQGHENIVVLENSVWEKDGIRVLGCTLWTELLGEDGLDQAMDIRAGMNDFVLIEDCTLGAWQRRFEQSVAWLKEELAKPYGGKTIVMTHHAPSFKSSQSRYKGSGIQGGWLSNLEYLIEEEQPDVWVHGHVHDSFDYNIGKTRILCNPNGYGFGIYANHAFKETLTFEL